MDYFISAYQSLSAIFFLWLGYTVWTLRKTVQAQASTIDAFKSLNAGMKALLDSTDEPAMLKRMKAYREIVDREMEARIKNLEQEKHKATKSDRAARAARVSVSSWIDQWGVSARKLLKIVARLMVYFPPEERPNLISEMDFGKEDWIEKLITKIATEAPYISPEEESRHKGIIRRLSSKFISSPPSPKED